MNIPIITGNKNTDKDEEDFLINKSPYDPDDDFSDGYYRRLMGDD